MQTNSAENKDVSEQDHHCLWCNSPLVNTFPFCSNDCEGAYQQTNHDHAETIAQMVYELTELERKALN